jgi:hypothetical protein
VNLFYGNTGNQVTVPAGGGAGRVFKVSELPVNVMVGAYYNVVKPHYRGDWQCVSCDYAG